MTQRTMGPVTWILICVAVFWAARVSAESLDTKQGSVTLRMQQSVGLGGGILSFLGPPNGITGSPLIDYMGFSLSMGMSRFMSSSFAIGVDGEVSVGGLENLDIAHLGVLPFVINYWEHVYLQGMLGLEFVSSENDLMVLLSAGIGVGTYFDISPTVRLALGPLVQGILISIGNINSEATYAFGLGVTMDALL